MSTHFSSFSSLNTKVSQIYHNSHFLIFPQKGSNFSAGWVQIFARRVHFPLSFRPTKQYAQKNKSFRQHSMFQKPLFSTVFPIFCSFNLYQLSEFYFNFPLSAEPNHFHKLGTLLRLSSGDAFIYVNGVFNTRETPNKQGLSAVLLRRKPSFLCLFSVFQRLCPLECEPVRTCDLNQSEEKSKGIGKIKMCEGIIKRYD